MASKQEKSLLGLPETATDEDVVKRISDLVAAEQLLDGRSDGGPGRKIALASGTGQEIRRGTYIIPPQPNFIVLDYDAMLAEDGGAENVKEIEGDRRIIRLTPDMPLTPTSEIRRIPCSR